MAGCSKIFFWSTAGVKKLSIYGNCFFILTLLGVCHETVAFFCPLNTILDTIWKTNCVLWLGVLSCYAIIVFSL